MESPGKYLSIKNGTSYLSSTRHLFSGLDSKFLIKAKLRVGSGDGKGEVLMDYYDRAGNVRTGLVCDKGWDRVDAEVLCHSLGYQTGLPTFGGYFIKKT